MGLDTIIFGFIYRHCFILGSVFGFGALEGGIIYFLLITAGIFKIKDSKGVKTRK